MNMKICSIENCGRKHWAKGFCSMHYLRFQRYGDPFIVNTLKSKICSIKDCNKIHEAKGFCSMHYQRFKKNGDPLCEYVRPKKRCEIEGCNGFAHSRRFCCKHYLRIKRHGDPNYYVEKPKNIFEAFLRKIGSKTDTCWFWRGSHDINGYGYFKFNKKHYLAHRVSYMHFKGPIDSDLVVMHSCDNPSCINPDHLTKGKPVDNIRDMCKKNRQAKGSKAGSAKLNEKQVCEILIKLNMGASYKELSAQYNVCKSTIRFIDYKQTWKHVEVEHG